MRGVLITGGNGGLGLAVGREFLTKDEKCRVWLGVRANRDQAEELAAAYPGRCEALTLDVASPENWRAALMEIPDLEVLVNNAGSHDDSLLATMRDEAWRGVMDSNLDSVFFGCRAAISLMIRRKTGRIINISSLSALMAPAGQTNYAAAKAGVIALTRSLAKETARLGITVNAVLPGYIDTRALAGMDEEAAKRARASVPMRRFGKPEEVAAAVYFLASAEAAYITGAELKIDGGIY